jgi:thiamine biosynthesis lipoprotein
MQGTMPDQLELRRVADGYQGLFKAMGSPCELLVSTSNEKLAQRLLQTVADEAWRIEAKFSRYRADSIVSAINEGKGRPVAVDDETANLLDFSARLYELSEHRFDITSGVLRKVWTFDGSHRIPSADSIRELLACIGWHRVTWSRPVIHLQPGMQIDLGGIGKEYAADKAADLLRQQTTDSCLVNFGGDLVTTGHKRLPNGWQVGIEAPDHFETAQRLIRLSSGALATSGDSRRCLVRDGIRYSHILDPTTGWPIEGAPRSITVAANTCTEAGMLATLAMLSGAQAEEFLESQNVQFWVLR